MKVQRYIAMQKIGIQEMENLIYIKVVILN